MEQLQILFAYAIVGLPLLASALILFFALPSRTWAARLSIGSLLMGFVLSALLFVFHLFDAAHHGAIYHVFPWITVANLKLNLGVMVDPLSILMSLVVTRVRSSIS